MKRMISVVLWFCMLLSLWGCVPDAGTTEAGQGEVPVTTAPNATIPVYAGPLSQESILASPQVGEYAESALLANVEGQDRVALLSVRSDGTVDYIFYSLPEESTEDLNSGGDVCVRSLAESNFRYYTIDPEGQATLQPSDWMTQLDQILAEGLAESAYSDATWTLRFSACEDSILMLICLNNNGRRLKTALYRLQDHRLTELLLPAQSTSDGQTVMIPPNSVRHVYAIQDGFLFAAQSDGEGNWYACSDDGTYVTQTPMEPDNLWGVMGVGGDTVWFTNAQRDRWTVVRTGDLEQSTVQPPDSTYVYCSATTPDGTAVYLLHGAYGSSRIQLSRFSEAGEELLIEDPSLYAFGSPGAVPDWMAVAPDGTFYSWTWESGRGVLRQYRYNPEGARQPQVRTVYSLEDNQTVQAAVTSWNRTHTDVIFQYVVAADTIADTALTLEDAVTQLNTQLFNGEGPDVLILDGLPADSLMDKGFLHPLSGLDTAGVYPKLLERFTADGNLYAIPAKMTPYLLGRQTEKTEAIDSLEAFADFVESATEKLDCSYMAGSDDWCAKALYYINFSDQVFDLWYPAWSEAIWAEGRFQPEVYQEFLTQTDRLVEYYSLKTIDELLTVCEESSKTGLTKTEYQIVNATDTNSHRTGSYPFCLAATDYVGLRNFCVDPKIGSLRTIPCEIVGIPGPDGVGATVPTCIAALREGADAEAGTAFLQLLLSDEIQLGSGNFGIFSSDGYPVKWSCTPALLQVTEETQNQKFDLANDFQAVLSQLRPVILYELPYNAAKEAALRFYEGALTAQEAADQVSAATTVYLAEQRW